MYNSSLPKVHWKVQEIVCGFRSSVRVMAVLILFAAMFVKNSHQIIPPVHALKYN